MSSEDQAISNDTFVRPAMFFINGFQNVPHIKYFYIFLAFVYVVTVLGNGFLLALICLVKILHTPKYLIVFNLAVTDLCASTALIPKLLDVFLLGRRYILYEACVSYMFFIYFFVGVHMLTLVTLAYDRFIAICFPLRYHSFVTKSSIGAMLLFSWLFTFILLTYTMKLIDRLSFCRSFVINSFYCDHGPVRLLACNDTSLNNKMLMVLVVTHNIIPVILIAGSYVCISIALSRIASKEERLKALQTCTSHLIVVAVCFLPYLGNAIPSLVSYIHPNTRMINSALTHTIPPLINPIIYSLKTEEVLTTIKKLYRKKMLPTASFKQ